MRCKNYVLALAVLLSACASESAELTNKANKSSTVSIVPPVASFSSTGLESLDMGMKQFVTDRHVYGIHTRLVRGDDIVAETQYGLKNVVTQEPIADDTIYRIYSMTKPITGVAMMQLYEQGKWKLDDPVTKIFPEFENLRVLSGQNEAGEWQYAAAERAPTMQELMSHTAGFAYGLGGDDPANVAFRDGKILRAPNLDVMIDKIAQVPLLFQPGEQWFYSAAVDIQGAAIERLSGQSLGAYMEEHIFAPLGMEDTAFYVSDDEYNRLSQAFGYNPETGQLVPLPYPTVQFKQTTIALESGGGGLTSTMDDYTAFCQMLLNEGELNGARLLKPETIELMRTNVLTSEMPMWSSGNARGYESAGLGFGLDFGIITEPEVREANYGEGSFFWGGAAGTWFWIDPVNDLFFIGMIQRFPAGGPEGVDLRGTSAKLVYDALSQ